MGNGGSKSSESTDINTPKRIEDNPSSFPISTPKTDCLDPRSPSNNISRTPLELILYENEEKFITEYNTPIQHKILDCDPRSPTNEYDRTPIVINVTNKSEYPRNKNLDNVFKLHTHLVTPKNIKKTNSSSENNQKRVPPKLLESSPVNAEQINKAKRRSFVGLLETNIDYTETDLDDLTNLSNSINKSPPSKVIVDNKKSTEPEIIENESEEEEISNQATNTENQEEIDTISKKELPSIKNDSTPRKNVIDISANVNDLEKKLSNLIYEDDENVNSNINEIIVSDKPKENNRNPLSVRNANDRIKLKVSDKPRKSDYAISKIPVYKKKMLNVQCENTPPSKDMKLFGMKTKKSHWDGDLTLVI